MKGVTLPTETVFVMENSPIKFGTVEVPPGIFHFFSDFSDACIVACISLACISLASSIHFA